MNLLEHGEFIKDTMAGSFLGKVEDIEDPSRLGRVRVRVYGVYELPIRLEDIPWAVPAVPGRRPAIGEIVPVMFMNDNHYRPIFF